MPPLSFRTKLLGAMLLVVVGVSGATLWITQRRVQDAYIKLFHNQAAQLADAIGRVQVQRADTIKQISKSLSSSVRLRAILQRVNNATEQNDTEDLPAARERLYQVVADQLGANQFMGRPDFFRLLDASGRVLAAPPTVETGMTNAAEAAQLDRSFTAAGRFAGGLPEQPTVGLLPIEPKEGSPRLMEVVVTPVKDADTAELLGVLAMGFSMAFPAPGN